MKWIIHKADRLDTAVKLYVSETIEYLAAIEVYAGARGKVCEWSIWFYDGGQDHGVCYGLVEAKSFIERAVVGRRLDGR